ncbi:outer membrane protein [Mesorhizobium sp. CAU 1732]|uniref:outer membrane protein n=1 Tax=Mesorhizobium sp. CAU 1732 TaxID=3140358 RepID=UPI003260B8BE
MKKLLLVSATFAMLAAPAYAADAIVYEPTPVAPMAPAVFDWTGFYVGVQGGYAWTHLGNGADIDLDGGQLGAHAGANWQSGAFVFGLEADVDYNWNETDFVVIGSPAFGTFELDWQGSARIRAGYAFDRTLVYVTGGVAAGRIEGTLTDAVGDFFRETHTEVGYTVGAGVEHAFAEKWTGRLEYRYTDFGEFHNSGVDVDQHAIKAGLSFRF